MPKHRNQENQPVAVLPNLFKWPVLNGLPVRKDRTRRSLRARLSSPRLTLISPVVERVRSNVVNASGLRHNTSLALSEQYQVSDVPGGPDESNPQGYRLETSINCRINDQLSK